MRDANLNLTFATQGGLYVSDTNAHTGTFVAIHAHTICVISAITVSALWSGSPSSVTINAGETFPFPGAGATSVTLASGTATLINA